MKSAHLLCLTLFGLLPHLASAISVANGGALSNISANSGTVAALDSAAVGDEIVVSFSLLNQATALSTVVVSDNLNGSYTQSGTQAVNSGYNSGGGCIIVSFVVHVTVAGTPNITITTTGYTGSFISPAEMRLTSASGTGTLDAGASANAQGTGTAIVNAPGSTAHANEMSVAISRTDNSGISNPAGWSTSFGSNSQWQLYTSGSSAVSFPATMSPSQGWVNSIVTIYDPAPPPILQDVSGLLTYERKFSSRCDRSSSGRKDQPSVSSNNSGSRWHGFAGGHSYRRQSPMRVRARASRDDVGNGVARGSPAPRASARARAPRNTSPAAPQTESP